VRCLIQGRPLAVFESGNNTDKVMYFILLGGYIHFKVVIGLPQLNIVLFQGSNKIFVAKFAILQLT
jgi:hypothetical protein